MTREEREQAIEVLQAKIDSIEDDQAYSQLSKSMYEDGYRRIDACKAAIAALRGPQPDPITGLVPCGCGGKAKYFYDDKWGGDTFLVGCVSCCARTTWRTLKESKEIWNRAIGWREKE